MPFIELPWIRLHYLEEGEGPPLVWLPGGNDSAALMLHAHRHLAARVRLICIDPRGQGESDSRHTPEDYAPAEHVRDLGAALDRLGLEHVTIGGHSRGGRTSVEFALTYPARVQAVIAACSQLMGSTSDRSGNFHRYRDTLSGEGVDAFLALLPSAPRHPERRAYWRASAHRAGPAALISQYEALTRLGPLAERLRSFRSPALFLTGDRDFFRSHAERAAAAAPEARLVVVANAGHAPFVDNPTDYFSALHTFLDDVHNTNGAPSPSGPAGE